VLKTYRELVVWQKAFRLCTQVYRATARFSPDERFGLTAQLRRAAVSILSDITEGYGRGSTRDYVRFLWVANGSVAEIETQLLLARELGYASTSDLDSLLESVAEVERMLKALIRSLEAKVK
jgi:four helix bundle protein